MVFLAVLALSVGEEVVELASDGVADDIEASVVDSRSISSSDRENDIDAREYLRLEIKCSLTLETKMQQFHHRVYVSEQHRGQSNASLLMQSCWACPTCPGAWLQALTPFARRNKLVITIEKPPAWWDAPLTDKMLGQLVV
jgi:hypothetical protein